MKYKTSYKQNYFSYFVTVYYSNVNYRLPINFVIKFTYLISFLIISTV